MKSCCKELFQKDPPHKKKERKKEKERPKKLSISHNLPAPPDDHIHLISLLGAKQQIKAYSSSQIFLQSVAVLSQILSVWRMGTMQIKKIFSNPSIFSADWLSIFPYSPLPVIFLGNVYIKWVIQEFYISSMTFSTLITIISILSHKSNCWQHIFASLKSCSLKFLSLPACPSTFPHMLWVCSLIFTIHLHSPSLPVPSGGHSTPHPVCISQLALSTSHIWHSKFFLLPFPPWPLPHLLTSHWLYLTQVMSLFLLNS